MDLKIDRTILRKIIRIVTWILVLFVILVIVLEIVFLLNRDNIRTFIISSVNREIAGEIVAASVNFSPLYHFPHFSIRLDDVELFEDKISLRPQSESAFCRLGRIYIGFDLLNLLHGHIDISDFSAADGLLEIVKRKDNTLNLLNFLKSPNDTTIKISEEAGSAVLFSLNRVSFENIRLTYMNAISDYRVDFRFKKFENDLTVHDQRLMMRLNPQIEILEIAHGGSSFLKNTRLEMAGDIDMDLDSLKGTIENGLVDIEGARLNIYGGFNLRDSSRVDLEVASSVNDPSLLLLLFNEEAIRQNLRNIRQGNIYCKGRIEGKLAGTIPFIEMEFGIKDLDMKIPDTDREIKNFGFEGYFTTGHKQDLSDGMLNIRHITANGRAGPSQGNILVRNFDQPEIEMDMNAVADLKNIDRAVRFVHIPIYSGVLDLKAHIHIKLDRQWENIMEKKGSVAIGLKDCSFLLENTEQVWRIAEGAINWENSVLSIRGLNLEARGNRWLFNGIFKNFAEHLLGIDSNVHAEIVLEADSLDLNSFLTPDDVGQWILDENPRNVAVDLVFDSNSRQLKAESDLPPGKVAFRRVRMDLKNVSDVDITGGVAIITPEVLDLRNIRAGIDKNEVLFSGRIRNYADLFANDLRDSCLISLDLASRHLKLKDLLTYKGVNYVPGYWAEDAYDDFNIAADLTLPADTDSLSTRPNEFKLILRDLNGVNTRTGKEIKRLGLRARQEGGDLIMGNINGRIGETTMNNTFVDLKDLFTDSRNMSLRLNLNCDSLNILDWIGFDPVAVSPASVGQTVPPDSGPRINETIIPAMDVSAKIGRITFKSNYMENFRISVKTGKENRFMSDRTDSTWWIPEIDLMAMIESDTFRTEYFKVPEAHDRITVTNGIIEILPGHTGIFGSEGTGRVRIDMSQKKHRYDLSYTLSNYKIETLLKRLRQREHMSGRIDLSLNLKMNGEDPTAMAGEISISGRNLTVYNLDIDELLKRFKRTQSFNLVDVGAFLIAGPAGTMITKASDYVSLLELDPSKKSRIHDFLSSWNIKGGRFMADDVVLTTDQNRIALKGGIDFIHNEFVGFTVAVVNEKGCPLISQKIAGSLAEPQFEKINVFNTVLAPVTKVLKKVGRVDCEPFYTGSVPHPGAK